MSTQKTWRIMGMTTTDQELLIVMGTSRNECESLFVGSMSDYSHSELREVETAWLEEWAYDECFDLFAWIPREELQLRSLRLKAAARMQHARRRESEAVA